MESKTLSTFLGNALSWKTLTLSAAEVGGSIAPQSGNNRIWFCLIYIFLNWMDFQILVLGNLESILISNFG